VLEVDHNRVSVAVDGESIEITGGSACGMHAVGLVARIVFRALKALVFGQPFDGCILMRTGKSKSVYGVMRANNNDLRLPINICTVRGRYRVPPLISGSGFGPRDETQRKSKREHKTAAVLQKMTAGYGVSGIATGVVLMMHSDNLSRYSEALLRPGL